MLPSAKSRKSLFAPLTATVTALALVLGAAAPAEALGRNERNVLKGVAGTIIAGAIINDMRQRQGHPPLFSRAPAPQPGYQAPPVYYAQPQPVQVYAPQPARRPVQQQTYRAPGIYSTPVAQAFNSYRPQERQLIQQRLAYQGYYRSGIDGAFGPGTYNAIVAYANDRGQAQSLNRTASVYGLFDGLMY